MTAWLGGELLDCAAQIMAGRACSLDLYGAVSTSKLLEQSLLLMLPLQLLLTPGVLIPALATGDMTRWQLLSCSCSSYLLQLADCSSCALRGILIRLGLASWLGEPSGKQLIR